MRNKTIIPIPSGEIGHNTFWNLLHLPILHISNPITIRLPEKSDKAILDSSARLTTFEKPDSVICIQDEVVMVGTPQI